MQTLVEINRLLEYANAEVAAGNPQKALQHSLRIDWQAFTHQATPHVACNIGTHYARNCTRETATIKKIAFFQLATAPLLAAHSPEFCFSRATLNLGILHENLAMSFLNAAQTNEQAGIVLGLLAEAVKYYVTATGMDDPEGKMVPQIAANSLGRLYLLGAGVKKDTAKAFTWFIKAAENGWWEAQVNTAVSHYTRRGARRSVRQTIIRMEKAVFGMETSQIPVDPSLKQAAQVFLDRLKSKTTIRPKRPTDAPRVLKNLAIKPPEL